MGLVTDNILTNQNWLNACDHNGLFNGQEIFAIGVLISLLLLFVDDHILVAILPVTLSDNSAFVDRHISDTLST
jgi:hypothetical protein